ncbi:unnamed protein product [Polarella glacialis]|uniref:Uncharacterized protein n=1 Tax=Polarella glacialis TaxID=89957 RepID=A0A813D3Q7_POLGL|nr:unnamed protein product [Polarella glacialis]
MADTKKAWQKGLEPLPPNSGQVAYSTGAARIPTFAALKEKLAPLSAEHAALRAGFPEGGHAKMLAAAKPRQSRSRSTVGLQAGPRHGVQHVPALDKGSSGELHGKSRLAKMSNWLSRSVATLRTLSPVKERSRAHGEGKGLFESQFVTDLKTQSVPQMPTHQGLTQLLPQGTARQASPSRVEKRRKLKEKKAESAAPPPTLRKPKPSWDDAEAIMELVDAAKFDDIFRVRLLLLPNEETGKQMPADVEGAEGWTPALCAAKNGHARSCAALLDAGADPLARDGSPCFFGGDGIGLWPDEAVPDKFGVRHQPHEKAVPGRTLIYFLRITGQLEETMAKVFPMTRVKIVSEIASAMQELHGTSPLVVAARLGYAELMALLLTHFVFRPPPEVEPARQPLELSTSTDLPIQPWKKQTGVSMAFLEQKRRAVESARSDRAEALLVACAKHHWRVAEVLLMCGVTGCSINMAKDRLGRTPLHIAATAGQEASVRMMLKMGASPWLYSNFGRQPLHDACAAGHAAVAAALVTSGAHVDSPVRPAGWQNFEADQKTHRSTTDRDMGRTAIEVAADRGHHHVCQSLLDCQVEPAGL